ncbi:MAG: outer membrane beta-barrel protein [Vicinamibacteria bacterium]
MAWLGALPALAGPQDKKVTLEFGGGGTLPLGNTGKAVSIGGNVTAGLDIKANDKVSLQLQYQYSRFDVKGNLFDVTAFDANHAMQYVDLNVVYASHGRHANGPYLAFGGGAYDRKVDITKFDGYSGGAVCNPWLLVCYPVGAPVEHVVGARSRWDFGANVGVGMRFQVTRTIFVFLESRYHFVFGPSFDTPTGSQKANGQYLPLSLGFQF